MTTAWSDRQHEPITWEMFLDIDEEVRRDLEIVDGYVVPREQRSRQHQKVATRLSLVLETAAVQQMRKTGGSECYETNTEVDVLLWEVPPTARKPDAVLRRCIPDTEQLSARHVLVAAEVLSTWSGRRDRVHKMSDYADWRSCGQTLRLHLDCKTPCLDSSDVKQRTSNADNVHYVK